jgi:predicted ATP-grasp superfamily ATP-dependent carboligase
MRVLLSEGSGLTSRQVATRLGDLGHEVEVLTSAHLCLSRFTRHVRKLHRVPPFGQAPFAWLEAALAVAHRRGAGVLLPTHEQVAVLSAMSPVIDVATIVPPFKSLRRVQDKVSACRTLSECGVPQPGSVVISSSEGLAQVTRLPVFVKRPISTASAGVRKASTSAELRAAFGSLSDGTVLLVQESVRGPLAMLQAVADRGRLIAIHASKRVREGIGGGAAVKTSIAIPEMTPHLQALVGALDWHGPISLDVILAEEGPVVIDVNPRLVEPMNAFRAGVDLVGAVLALALGQHPPVQPWGKPGVRTFQLLLAILGAANDGSRAGIVRELVRAVRHQEPYTQASEELTPVRGDPIAAIPVMVAAMATLLHPPLWHAFHSSAVASYSLTSAAWDEIVRAVATGSNAVT